MAYSKCIAQDYTQEDAYSRAVEEFSYRLLDRFTYEKNPMSFRSDRCTSPPPETEGSMATTNLLDYELHSNSPVIIILVFIANIYV